MLETVFNNAEYEYMTTAVRSIVTRYIGPGGDVVVPATLGGLPVTEIGNRAFFGRRDLTSISLPDTLVTIGYFAFGRCRGLTSITLPDATIKIGQHAFSGCVNLLTVEGVPSMVHLRSHACDGCDMVTILARENVTGNTKFISGF